MDPALWLPPTAAAIIAIFGALWNTGGASALARRVINQEVSILAGLPGGAVKTDLTATIRDRTALYLFRRRGPIPNRWGRREARIATFAAFLPPVATWLQGHGPSWANNIFWPTYVVSVLVVGVLLARRGNTWVRRWRRRRWATRVAAAHAYLEQADVDPGLAAAHDAVDAGAAPAETQVMGEGAGETGS